MTEAELDQLCVNTIRTLSIDAVQAADSGHPGNADGARAGLRFGFAPNKIVAAARAQLGRASP